MLTESITGYFVDGYRLLMEHAQLSVDNLASVFNLVTVLDILLVLGIVSWLWIKIRHTALARAIPNFVILLLIFVISKMLGLVAVSILSLALMVVLLVAAILIYSPDLQKVVEGAFISQRTVGRIKTLSDADVNEFIRDLSDTIGALAKLQIPSLIVVRVTKPVSRLIEQGTSLHTPFNRDFVIDTFSHRSKLSSGAMIVDRGLIVAAGSTLTVASPKRFPFTLDNPAIRQAATHWEALAIITSKNTDTVSLLHKNNTYAKLATGSLERVLKSILLAK
ncbi:MAG: diadenylate cyclase [Patescibacteria group bacterium]|jgi:DNA integrity scanning protein DisA with diadenylate cyclase activity